MRRRSACSVHTRVNALRTKPRPDSWALSESYCSLVYLFHEGISAEGMVESYPSVTLEQVHGALAFYLANRKEIDAYLADGLRAAELQHRQSRQTNADLVAKLQRARHASQIPG